MIWTLAATVFATNLIFLWARTWNVRAIADKHIWGVMWSGTVVHLSWLVSISIGAVSITEIMRDWSMEYIPVVIASLSGGLLGSYIGMLEKKEKCTG